MKKIIDNAIFVLGVIAAIFFLLFNSKIGVLLVGLDIIFILISILLLINKSPYGIVLGIVSATLGLTLFLHHIKYFTVADCFTFTFVFSLLALTTFSTLKYVKELFANSRTHEMLVEAAVIDLIKNPNLAIDYYIPLLGYEIDGEKFEVNYITGFKKNVPEIGEIFNIYVNPNDHYDVYFKPPVENIIKSLAVNVVIIFFTLLILSTILH